MQRLLDVTSLARRRPKMPFRADVSESRIGDRLNESADIGCKRNVLVNPELRSVVNSGCKPIVSHGWVPIGTEIVFKLSNGRAAPPRVLVY
jgi:hypothetical protein